MGLLDARFKYTPSTKTDVASTWRRFGFRPTTSAERNARLLRSDQQPATAGGDVTPLQQARRKTKPALRLTVRK